MQSEPPHLGQGVGVPRRLALLKQNRMVHLSRRDGVANHGWSAGYILQVRPKEPSSLGKVVQVTAEGPPVPRTKLLSWSFPPDKGPSEWETRIETGRWKLLLRQT